MVLPVLGSFLAPALFPAMNPLLAGSIGSGIGSLLQGDDFGDAIKTGLLSFAGGKLLGGLGKMGEAVPTNPEVSVLGGKQITMAPYIDKSKGYGFNLTEALKGPTPITPLENSGMFVPKEPFNFFKAASTKGDKIMAPLLNQGIAIAKANPMLAAGVGGGAALGSALSAPKDEGTEKSDYQRTETMPIQDNIRFPTPRYRPGVDPEFNYGFYNPPASELQKVQVLQEGGDVDTAPERVNEKDVIVNAVNALKGNMSEEQASIALAMFVNEYGEEALKDLITDVRDGEYDNITGKMDGQVQGGGDGMSDSVPATIDGKQDLLASKDEYMVDAPTVAMIGNGSSDAGAKKLDKMREEVRKAATGSTMQPKQIDAEKIMRSALS